MPIFGQKNVNSVKNTLYYGPNKSIRYPFFRFFMKKYCSHTHILLKKLFILTKTRCSHVIFFYILMKKHRLSCPYLVKKPKFCHNYTILWAKTVNKMQFFPIFNEKYLFSCPYFVKKTSIFKKHYAFMPIFWQQNFHSLKYTVH